MRRLFQTFYVAVGLFFAFYTTLEFSLRAEETNPDLRTVMESARRAAWERFYSPETRLFYDFLQSHEPGESLAHLPTRDEVENLYPNPCGYGTAMEDCAISGGGALEALIDRYKAEESDGASRELLEQIKREAREVFLGLRLLVTVSGSPGFVARGVSPKAPDLCYINSSRDQVTHLTLAVWEYYRSPLVDVETRALCAEILYAIADRMTRNVTPENDYDFLCCDGSRCRFGICRMWNVEDHEAARLVAIYATASDVARREGNEEREREYDARYQERAREAIAQSAHIKENPALYNRMPSYAFLQMQESLAVLYRLETNPELRAQLLDATRFVSERVKLRFDGALQRLKSRDQTVVAPDWRQAGGLNGEYRATWYTTRECGEIALTILLDPSDSFDSDCAQKLVDALKVPDYDKLTSCGLLRLLGAYEKARLLKKL